MHMHEHERPNAPSASAPAEADSRAGVPAGFRRQAPCANPSGGPTGAVDDAKRLPRCERRRRQRHFAAEIKRLGNRIPGLEEFLERRLREVGIEGFDAVLKEWTPAATPPGADSDTVLLDHIRTLPAEERSLWSNEEGAIQRRRARRARGQRPARLRAPSRSSHICQRPRRSGHRPRRGRHGGRGSKVGSTDDGDPDPEQRPQIAAEPAARGGAHVS
jgi:hypothetical protein